jgi:hypothetical protein
MMLGFLAVPKKVLRVFLLVIHSHLYSFALTFLTQPLTVSLKEEEEENLIESDAHFPMV